MIYDILYEMYSMSSILHREVMRVYMHMNEILNMDLLDDFAVYTV